MMEDADDKAREIVLAAFYHTLRRRYLWTVAIVVLCVVLTWTVLLTVHQPRMEELGRHTSVIILVTLLLCLFLIGFLAVVEYRIKHRLFGTWRFEKDLLRDFLIGHGRDLNLNTLLPRSSTSRGEKKPEG